jgi:hypothetical protein
VNSDGKPHGRGICIWNRGTITIGHYENGNPATGNYITISSDGGGFDVGEKYLEDDFLKRYGISYCADGTAEEFDY